MSCCTNGDCCGPGSYCCANTGPHKHPELVSDLRVVIHPKQRDHQALRDHTRPATVPEVVAWLREQGAVDVVAELQFARDAILGWAGYASDYFKDKWDLDGDLARIDAALAALDALPGEV